MNGIGPGQIYVGKCLTSFEPMLWFYYVILSGDTDKEGQFWWTTAQFMEGCYGAQIKKFTEKEIRNLGYVGHILSVLGVVK